MNWQPPDPYRPRYTRQPPARWSGWKIAGVALATVLGLCGLALLMLIVLFVVAMNSYGSNK